MHDFEVEKEKKINDSASLGAFYKHINRALSHKSDIGTLTDSKGEVLLDNLSKANLFNEYFASVGVKDDGIKPLCITSTSYLDKLETIHFDCSNVKAAMQKLKSNLSSGPDNMPPVLFKRLKNSLATPLAMAFEQLLSVAAVPNEWKSAIITPVFKKGVTSIVSNYRPISLTCVPSKIMERVITQQILDHLQLNNILHPSQHGFLKGRSTCTNLLESINDWTLYIENSNAVVIAYVDFSKAFDSVCHEKLFVRLLSYGIDGTLLKWLQNFFCDRTLQTRVGKTLSESASLCSGVVQGSGIGPLMFLIFLNELAAILEKHGVKVKFFADDVKIYSCITNNCDCDKLKNALQELAEWAKTWQLSVSIDKCYIVNIGCFETDDVNYCLNDTVLPTVKSCRDLGVIISNDLSPSLHINAVVAKAHQRANIILRCFLSRNITSLVKAFKVYVRPLVEYNSIIWSPQQKQHIECVERVQRCFTKRLPGMNHLSYDERLKCTGLQCLELRRLQFDLIWCYKIVFGLVNVDSSDFFHSNTCIITRGHPYKLYKQHCKKRNRAEFFTQRVLNLWNSLPQDTVNFNSLFVFKNTIKRLDMSKYVKLQLES